MTSANDTRTLEERVAFLEGMVRHMLHAFAPYHNERRAELLRKMDDFAEIQHDKACGKARGL